MKKVLPVILFFILVIGGGVGYYFLKPTNDYGPTRSPRDLSGIIVPPIVFSMKGREFIVPQIASTTATSSEEITKVTLNLLSPSAKRDYPMARFEEKAGVGKGTLVALDNFTTEVVEGRQAVPLIVNFVGRGEFYYLAVLETADNGSSTKHILSLPIGDRIKIKDVKNDGTLVSVTYLEHAREQAMAEIPVIETTAIYDLVNGKIVQEGRKPWLEEEVIVKSFTGEYLWQDTKMEDGASIKPIVPDKYTLKFDANNIILGTDCNTGGASFTAGHGTSTSFTISPVIATEKFCEATQETDYFSMFNKIVSYQEETDGTLIFTLSDKSIMTFIPRAKVLPYEKKQTETSTTSNPQTISL